MILKHVGGRIEQAVYGSFAFWGRGYGILARSSGCRPEWIAALKAACQRYGERPLGTSEAEGLFAMRPTSRALDDRGRLSPGLRRSGPARRPGVPCPVRRPMDLCVGRRRPIRFPRSSPRRLDSERTWIRPCPRPARIIHGAAFRRSSGPDTLHDERLRPIVEAIEQGRRVIVQSAGPIDAMARDVWRALPMRARLRASVATWAFDNANRFDLVALPKLAGIQREDHDLIVAG